MIKLVVIDFDDTLSLTEEAFFTLENLIAQKMGFAPMSRDAHKANWGKPLKYAIIERIPGIDADEFMRIHKELLPEYVKTGKGDVISEENIQTLRMLKELGKHLAILTSRTYPEVSHLLDENHHTNRYIQKIYHMDNLEYHKPDPRVFLKVLEEFAVTPDEGVYVGDSLSDGISAKGAQLHFIALLESGLRKKEDFSSIPVDFFANTFPEILNYIEKN